MKVRLLTSSPTLFTPALRLILFLGCVVLAGARAGAAEAAQSSKVTAAVAPAGVTYEVRAYRVESRVPLATNVVADLLTRHTGPRVALNEIVQTAADVALAYRQQGYTTMNIIIAPKRITNGVVTLSVFPGAVEQIVVAGKAYQVSSAGLAVASPPSPNSQLPTAVSTAASAPAPTAQSPKPSSAGPRFEVKKYAVEGNSILPPETLGKILANIDGAYGTNVSLDGIRTAANELQSAYRVRGYVTVAVSLPPQKLTNGIVKIKVTEGRLADITVKGNHYFSSNNVMRSLPSLHQGMILNGQVFQAELNQSNGNQDRQIYPVIDPGPDPGTSDLTLKVKDRIPLHGKVELNNQSSPGTPAFRQNASAVYNNLWQREHSLGFQYGFSPGDFKEGSQWDFYDRPLVANYSAFYRMPLGTPDAIEDVITANPGTFGYNEASGKYNLPPPSGQSDLTFFASRSTIDTGLIIGNKNIFQNLSTNNDGSVTPNGSLNLTTPHQDLTINNDMGFRLSLPLRPDSDFHSGVSGGVDFKSFNSVSSATNTYIYNSVIIDPLSGGSNPQTNYNNSTNTLAVPLSENQLYYLPLSVRYDASWHDFMGMASFGIGLNANLWYSAQYRTLTNNSTSILYKGVQAMQIITGGSTNSARASGHWVVLNPSFSQNFEIASNWITTFRADGQWASEPLISNEQFGAGGVSSVRGYQEGEIFGDTGIHLSLEQATPAHVVGPVYGNTPLTVRGSVYVDYARDFFLDPQGRPPSTSLLGTGFGAAASIGSQWEARFLFSIPLLSTAITGKYHPFFNFALSAQF